MNEKDYQVIKGDNNRINRLRRMLPDVFKAMWIGEVTKKPKQVDKQKEAYFNSVINDIHERQERANAYKKSLHADTNGGAIQRKIEDRHQESTKKISQDRAD